MGGAERGARDAGAVVVVHDEAAAGRHVRTRLGEAEARLDLDGAARAAAGVGVAHPARDGAQAAHVGKEGGERAVVRLTSIVGGPVAFDPEVPPVVVHGSGGGDMRAGGVLQHELLVRGAAPRLVGLRLRDERVAAHDRLLARHLALVDQVAAVVTRVREVLDQARAVELDRLPVAHQLLDELLLVVRWLQGAGGHAAGKILAHRQAAHRMCCLAVLALSLIHI